MKSYLENCLNDNNIPYGEIYKKMKAYYHASGLIVKERFKEGFEKLVKENERRKIQFRLRSIKEYFKKKVEERKLRRNGHSTIKPVSFYEEIYIEEGAPLSFEDINIDNYRMREVENRYNLYTKI